jgi:hypothetical protein
VNDDGFEWMARHAPPPTEPRAWRPEQILDRAIAADKAQQDQLRIERHAARDIRIVKKLVFIAVTLLAVLVLGSAAGAAFMAVAGVVGKAPAVACKTVISRC